MKPVHAQGLEGTLCQPHNRRKASSRLQITSKKEEVTCKTCLRALKREANWLELWGPKPQKTCPGDL